MSFTGKVIIVTGAASGIGAATAELFAKEGATVVMVDKDDTKLRLVEKQAARYGHTTLSVVADVADDDDAQSIIKETIDKFGKLDVLVNCAGILAFGSILGGNLVKVYDRLFNINLRSIIQLTSLAAPHLIVTKGNIVNIASMGAYHIPTPEFTAYCTSKAAVLHFTKGAALELASHGVRVNSVSPGSTRTNIGESTGQEIDWDHWIASSALNRVSEPVEVADLIMYLTSDKAKGITGSNFVIDNGQLLK